MTPIFMLCEQKPIGYKFGFEGGLSLIKIKSWADRRFIS